ncbi:MAG TPA: TrkA family potassium uptake protein [Kofleriaceae bacterium]
MTNHMLVCGVGATGRHIIDELCAAKVQVVAIDVEEDSLVSIRERHPDADFTYFVGDATDDEILTQAGIATARAIAAVLPSDKDNLYIVVAARQANANARVVARASEATHVEKLKRVGANSVVLTPSIGGRRLATELERPVFARFLDDMLKDPAGYRFNEVTISEGHPLVGLTLEEARIRDRFGMGVLAIAQGEEPWRYNPETTERLVAGTTLIVLGSSAQVDALRKGTT